MLDSTLASEIHRLSDLAAMQGHHGGLYMKGLCYWAGVGVECDYVEARRWFERAAATTGRWQPHAIDQLAKLDADLASGAAPGGSSRATS